MSDSRWTDVEEDFASAARHLSLSVELFRAGGFEEGGLDGYRARMGLMHAMQSGHTSLEAGLLRVMEILEEEPPGGPDWHAVLLHRAARVMPHRPPILGELLVRDADETRRFRHRATRGYDSFDPDLARRAVGAAGRLAAALPEAIATFRRAVDP